MSGGLISQSKKVIKVSPVMTAADAADNDVAFEWTAVRIGSASKLTSVAILDADNSGAALELVFCLGAGTDGTAPTAAQGLIGGAGTGDAVVDITAAEAQAIQICGNVQATLTEGDLLTAQAITVTNIGLILAPASNSDTIFIGGLWRGEPAETGAVGTLDIYLGFED